ncbi:DUF4097 family beta strand repeat-containing protein [Brevibacillus dissolubilis]|uniref:DUF4097 family beta strand repeat-containing protein n=1 Tax=Brevibacillus dissolubilis TaxID=1844116 RepID=UPI0011161301|nr:DUF4097 family beta strand repeat-containing protein [Brevibacillus dissolubilis]
MKWITKIGLGLFTVGLAGSLVLYGQAAAQMKTFDLTKTIPAKGIERIEIEGSVFPVELIPSNSDEIEIRLLGETSDTYMDNIELDIDLKHGDTLRIEPILTLDTEIISMKNLTLFQSQGKAVIAIPSQAYKQIAASTSLGDIHVNGLTADEFELSTHTGDITVTNSTGRLDLETDLGDTTIQLRELQDDIMVETNTGDVLLTLNTPPEAATFDLATHTGTSEVNLPDIDYQKQTGRHLKVTLGTQGPLVHIDAALGDITVGE